MKIYQVKSRYNDINWLGKLDSGEYIAIDADGRVCSYDLHVAESMADSQTYVSCCGSGYGADKAQPLTDADKALLEDAYVGEVSFCVECNIGHDTEASYGEDYQFTEDGLVCRDCFGDYLQSDADALDSYVNQARQCIPLPAAEALADKGKLKFIERFIGGMVDESGQFQTYFSVWQVASPGKRFKRGVK